MFTVVVSDQKMKKIKNKLKRILEIIGGSTPVTNITAILKKAN